MINRTPYLLYALILVFFSVLLGCNQEQAQVSAPPPQVTVAKPVVKNIINYAFFTGYTESRKSVELRARVEGYLEQVAFPSGGMVKKGDLLFVIDPKPYEAEVAQRMANLSTRQAEKKLAKATLERKESSYKQRAVSELAVLEAKANVSKSEAEVMGAEAAIVDAQLELSYTEIHSPINGRISRNFVDVGNLVGSAGDKTLLANIVNYDPIYVYFTIDESSLMLFKRHSRKVDGANVKGSDIAINLALEGENDYTRSGVLEYVDNKVDLSTGTIQARATFENTDLYILPGQYAKVRIPIQHVENAVLVPEIALSADQRGRFLLTVDSDNKVVYKPVQIGALQDGMRVIRKGISQDDRVIIKGIQRARPGASVMATEKGEAKQSSGIDQKK